MKKLKVDKSKIAGKGLFTTDVFKKGEMIGLAHENDQPTTSIGKNHNHSDKPNAVSIKLGNKRYLMAKRPLKKGEEITTNYRLQPELEQPEDFAKGGLVRMQDGGTVPVIEDAGSYSAEGYWIPDWEAMKKQAKELNAKTVKTKSGSIIYFDSNWDVQNVDDNPQMRRGGTPKSLVKMPKPSKKGLASKKFSRSLEATNRLFTENTLFAKPKSRKRKVFDPNAQYQDGGVMNQEEPTGGVISQEEIDASNRAMMKARLAYANMHGNPAAQRMVVAPDQPYVFDDGDTGTHFMASMDNYAVPLIQDVNGQLMLGDFGPESAEAMRFDNPEDAMYFAENYKQITPDESYRKEYPEEDYIEAELTEEEIEEYKKGGWVVEEIEEYQKGGALKKPKKPRKEVKPLITSNLKEYTKRKKAYNDSLALYKASLAEYDILKKTKGSIESPLYHQHDIYDAYKRLGYPKGYDVTILRSDNSNTRSVLYEKPIQPVYKKSNQPKVQKPKQVKPKTKVYQYPKEYKPVVNNVPKVAPEGKRIVGQEKVQQLDSKTGIVTTVINPIYETIIPPTVNPELQKFIEERKREPGTGADVMPVYDTDELPMYATPDGGAEWVGDTERYVDWDGNRIPYRLPRFRKPGHGGDLIRQGKKRYIPFPSIESRYQAEIVPEEEYKKGGEPKKRKKDSKGKSRSEDGNIRTPLTPEMQAIMSPEEWGQYVQEVPEVYTTRTKEQQDIRNALDYQQRMAELYPGRPTQSDAIQPADWFWQLGAIGGAGVLGDAVTAGEVLGTRALPYVEGAFNTIPGKVLTSGFAADAIVNRLYPSAGKIQEGNYGEAAVDIATGLLDIAGANMLTPMYKGAKATASELGKFINTGVPKELPGSPNSFLESGRAYKTIYPGQEHEFYNESYRDLYKQLQQQIEKQKKISDDLANFDPTSKINQSKVSNESFRNLIMGDDLTFKIDDYPNTPRIPYNKSGQRAEGVRFNPKVQYKSMDPLTRAYMLNNYRYGLNNIKRTDRLIPSAQKLKNLPKWTVPLDAKTFSIDMRNKIINPKTGKPITLENIERASPRQLELWKQEGIRKMQREFMEDIELQNLMPKYDPNDFNLNLNKEGGMVLELTDKEIKEYMDGGWIIQEM